MQYQKLGARVLIGNAMIPERFASAHNYAATLCFSICSDPDVKDSKASRSFCDISLTLGQLYDLYHSLSHYLWWRSVSVTSDRFFVNPACPFFDTLGLKDVSFTALYHKKDGSNMKAQTIYINSDVHSAPSRPCIRLQQIPRDAIVKRKRPAT
jgi:hypothetical protein